MSTNARVIYDDDPELLAMTEEEIVAEAKAAFGAWKDRDDITDDWLDEIRAGWQERLDDIYGPYDEDNPV